LTTNHLRVVVLAMAASAFAAIAVGCGDDGPDEAASLTKQQFIKRADALCLSTKNEQLDIATKYAKEHPGATEEDVVVPALIEPLEEEAPALRALSESREDDQEVQAFISAREEGLEKAKADPTLVAAPLTNNPYESANKMAKQYGLKSCAAAP
jgi:hypothetical protein